MAMWNMHGRVIDNLSRTNNSVEGWHRAFAASCVGHHLNVWRFLKIIQSEEDLSRITLVHIQQGRVAPRPHPVYVAVNEKIGTVVRDYPNGSYKITCVVLHII